MQVHNWGTRLMIFPKVLTNELMPCYGEFSRKMLLSYSLIFTSDLVKDLADTMPKFAETQEQREVKSRPKNIFRNRSKIVQIPNKTKQNVNNKTKPKPGKQSCAPQQQLQVRITWGEFDLTGLRVACALVFF